MNRRHWLAITLFGIVWFALVGVALSQQIGDLSTRHSTIEVEPLSLSAQVSGQRASVMPRTMLVGTEAEIAPVVARIHFDSVDALNRIAGELDIWEVDHRAGYFVAALHPDQLQPLQNAGYRYEIDERKTAEMYRPKLLEDALKSANSMGGIPGYACYRTVEETTTDLAQLAAKNSTLAQWIDIGDSWDKTTAGGPEGYDLNALILTNRNKPGPKFRFLLMAAIHARELTTAEIVSRFGEQVLAGYGVDPDLTWLLDYGELHIIPYGNPDGRKFAETGLWWRKNTRRDENSCTQNSVFNAYYGVDLNRNSSFKWNECEGFNCSTSNVCRDTFRGASPASEPETQTIQNYASSIFADTRDETLDSNAALTDTSGVFITVHSYSKLVLYPWGWRPLPAPNAIPLATLGRKFGFYTGYTACQGGAPGCIYQTDGTTDDWVYGVLGVPAYTFELGTEFFEECNYFEESIADDALASFRYAFKAAQLPYRTPAGPEVLDLTAQPKRILAGMPVTLTALADDTRYVIADLRFGSEATQPITAARVALNAPSWSISPTIALTATDGVFDSSVESVTTQLDTTGWSLGRHTLFVEGQDADGNWGVPSAIFVNVVPSAYLVSATLESNAQSALPGSVLTYTLLVSNLGIYSDTATITPTSKWPVRVLNNGPIEAGETRPILIEFDIPTDALEAETDSASITLVSAGDPGSQASVNIVSTVKMAVVYLPLIGR